MNERRRGKSICGWYRAVVGSRGVKQCRGIGNRESGNRGITDHWRRVMAGSAVRSCVGLLLRRIRGIGVQPGQSSNIMAPREVLMLHRPHEGVGQEPRFGIEVWRNDPFGGSLELVSGEEAPKGEPAWGLQH